MAGSTNIFVSVLIPTKDEERNIADCIKSVLWTGEIFVYDSMSSNRTVEIAENLCANVVCRSLNFSEGTISVVKCSISFGRCVSFDYYRITFPRVGDWLSSISKYMSFGDYKISNMLN